jgi:hypothetical protein
MLETFAKLTKFLLEVAMLNGIAAFPQMSPASV